jgi:hypothetical protein
MKRPRPTAPFDAPTGTTQLGGYIGWFSASLNVAAPDLKPEEVTQLLGATPTAQQTRGEPVLRTDGSVGLPRKYGRWSRTIKAPETDEWDVAEVIRDLFSGLPESLEVWSKVRQLGTIRISLGLSLAKNNEDFFLDAELIGFLADRGVSLWFDI